MDGDDDRWGHVHRDIFGEILKRLPPISGRRRIRLVCRRWRDGVDEMEPEMAATMRAKPLAVLKDSRRRTLSAFVVDGLPPAPRRATTRCIFQHVDDGGGAGGHHRHRYDRWPNNVGDQVVGTCNGILLLAHCRYVGSHTLVLLNSATGERLVVQPPLKAKEILGGSAALSFAYHPLTGEYKVVHLPVSSWKRALAVAEVLTVGDGDGGATSWRQVPAPAGSTCYLSWGVVSVDGATYWVGKGGKIMSLDLEHEIIAEVKQLPLMMEAHNVSSPPPPPTTATMGVDNGGCHLTEVGGRLGVAIATSQRGTTDVEVYHCFCVILTN
ncbi:hypothetical protein OsI_38387 [Oryza sativa Indica Group]|uniref:F-box domain-containing protein n=1 Tax=Oryza sativa subsp. indica TaxID=39946 RepID=A2ZKP2_ORYSI|nr:hypothetical protein OsI_38387 [Oryza sativa Indica Group]